MICAALNDFSPVPVTAPLEDASHLIDDLGLDSLAITEFVFFFEDAFELKISNDELVALVSVGELKRFLRSRIA